jgi:hypothetical protein
LTVVAANSSYVLHLFFNNKGLASATILLAHVINQVGVHAQCSVAVSVENVDELISNIDIDEIAAIE